MPMQTEDHLVANEYVNSLLTEECHAHNFSFNTLDYTVETSKLTNGDIVVDIYIHNEDYPGPRGMKRTIKMLQG